MLYIYKKPWDNINRENQLKGEKGMYQLIVVTLKPFEIIVKTAETAEELNTYAETLQNVYTKTIVQVTAEGKIIV
jgi:hypothetical protein